MNWLLFLTLGLGACLIPVFAAAMTQEAPGGLAVHIGGETRARYETLSGQFRVGGKGGDQMLALRTLVRAQIDKGAFGFVAELQDSRSYLGDEGTPYSTSLVNPLDLLQSHLRVKVSNVGDAGRDLEVKLGRMTLGIGSQRHVERVEFANVIFNYTGVYVHTRSAQDEQLHAFYVSPVTRLPSERSAMAENRLSQDETAWSRTFWAVHYIRPKLAQAYISDLTAEAYVYGLDEHDSRRLPTPDRHYVTPGFRLLRLPKPHKLDFEIEAAWRFGTRRATTQSADMKALKVRTHMLHIGLGWTSTGNLGLRVAADYDYAGGDKNPSDNRYDQYERLFGSQRTDLGNTGIYGPLTPANIEAPGFRIEIRPNTRFDARIAYKAASVASKRDTWSVAGVGDVSGKSGRFIGHAFDGRIRYWLIRKDLLAEVGGSLLMGGKLGQLAPNASRQGDTQFGYVQLTRYF